jgi:FkbM family methyltransferase
MAPIISYAQRYEDMHLLRAFGAQAGGFYIDIGAGHPVYDNVSFAFYLRGWRGITVEPNPWLAQLSEAVRPRDIRVASLVGEKEGQAAYYLVDDFHGLSTTIEAHARAAESEYGKRSRVLAKPVTTLRALCEQHAPTAIEFLKIDVEGAERDVLLGGDWQRYRPKVIVLEALAPVSLKPAWNGWEPLLLHSGYGFAYFDGLNRYYVAAEHAALAGRLAAAPTAFDNVTPFSRFKPALDDATHPDHGLAQLLSGEDMVRLPLMPFDALAQRLMNALHPGGQDQQAQPADIAALHQWLFGIAAPSRWADELRLAPGATIGGLYRSAVATDSFRNACGRISASTAW